MKKVNTSLSIIMIVVSLFVVTVAQAQQNVDVNDEVAVFALANWYPCHYGNLQPACDALGEIGVAEVTPSTVHSNALNNWNANWYACHYGNIQPACDALGEIGVAEVSPSTAHSDALNNWNANWYACYYGNFQPACDAIVVANNLARVD